MGYAGRYPSGGQVAKFLGGCPVRDLHLRSGSYAGSELQLTLFLASEGEWATTRNEYETT